MTSICSSFRPAFASARLTATRAEAHDLGIDAGVAVGDEPRHRLQALLFRCRLLHQHDAAAASLMPDALPAVTVPFSFWNTA
jgi:hypothetical protein